MMNFAQISAIIFAFCICVGICQDRIIVSNLNLNETDNNSSVAESIIPESLLIQMKDIRNVTELLRRFVIFDEEPLLKESSPRNTSTNTTTSGRRALSAASTTRFSEAANCKPELHVIELEKSNNAALIYWPSCVRIRRCGGCCTSTMLACKPVRTSIVNVTVMQLLYSIENPGTFDPKGPKVFSVEQHDRCSCSCKELPEDCDPDVHDYKASECRCACKNMEPAASCTGPSKLWDWKHCMCKCRNVRLCSTGRYFNTNTCRCEVLRQSLAVHNVGVQNSSVTLSLQASTATP